MLRKSIIAGLGLLAGFYFPLTGGTERKPLPPSEWTHSSLLHHYHLLKEELFEASRSSKDESNPYWQMENQPESELGQEYRATKRALSKRGSLLGLFIPLNEHLAQFQGRHSVALSCDRSDCCMAEKTKERTESEWEFRSSGGIGMGYRNPTGRYTIRLRSFQPFRLGIPFTDPFVEAPARGETETNVWGLDPNDRKWKIAGTMRWSKIARNGCYE